MYRKRFNMLGVPPPSIRLSYTIKQLLCWSAPIGEHLCFPFPRPALCSLVSYSTSSILDSSYVIPVLQRTHLLMFSCSVVTRYPPPPIPPFLPNGPFIPLSNCRIATLFSDSQRAISVAAVRGELWAAGGDGAGPAGELQAVRRRGR